MAKEGKGSKKLSAAAADGGAKPIDPRFAAAFEDPRFQRFPAARKSVAIDERFKGIFENPDFQTILNVDKRGRKVKKSKARDDMRKYYRLKAEEGEKAAEPQTVDDEAEPAGGKTAAKAHSKKERKAQQAAEIEARRRQADKGATESSSSSSSDEEPAGDQQAAAAERRWAYLRGVGQPSESDDSSSEGEAETDVEAQEEAALAEAERQWGVGALASNPRERIPDGTETCRLAAVDLDWEHIRAVDIFAALRSFLPSGGRIKHVKVYPSDYGLQRMQEEVASGPQGIYRPIAEDTNGPGPKQQRQKSTQAAEDSENEQEELEDALDSEEEFESGEESEGDAAEEVSGREADKEDHEAAAGGNGGSESDSAEDEVDKERLRMYERSKLRYYYAVIDFDSVATASRVYQECDGLEFQQSTCKFDLRFVPDEQSFEGREVRDEAKEVPDDYQAPNFQTMALQHTNPKLTWDADDTDRRRTLSRRITKEELRDDDFKAYLASESEGSEEDEAAAQAQREKFRGLLLGDGGAADTRKGSKVWGTQSEGSGEDDSEEEEAPRRRKDQDMEMELTFQGGLENLGQRLLAKQQGKDAKRSETVWQAYERRRREKKAAAKALGKHQVDSDEDISEPDIASDSEGQGDDGADPFFQHEDDPFNDPFFKDDAPQQQPAQKSKTNDKKGRDAGRQQDAEEAAADARRKAELELLLMDEDALRRQQASATGQGQEGKSGKVSKKERVRQKKAKRQLERQAGSDDEDLAVNGGKDSFRPDLADPRFQALFTSDQFALDPTDPRFKATEASTAIQKARAHRHDSGGSDAAPQPAKSANSSGKDIHLRALVANLKRKVGGSNSAASGPSAGSHPPVAKLGKNKKKRRVE